MGESLLEKALALNPNSVMALWMLGSVRNQQKRFSEAEDLCRQALTIDRDSQEAHLHLAIALTATKQLPEALQHAKMAVLLDRTDARPFLFGRHPQTDQQY